MSETPETSKSEADEEKREDYHDRKDAGRGEMCLYGVGGVLDELGQAGFANLQGLLTIAFQINPIIGGFLAAFKTLWDGLMDPIMAHITDNFSSRWGRRRPFILIGGILMPIISWACWYFIPEHSLVPNEPEVPKVEFSDLQFKRFGEMCLGYGVVDHDVLVEVADKTGGQVPEETLKLFVQTQIKDLRSRSKNTFRLVNAEEAETSEDPLITVRVEAIEASRALEDKPDEPFWVALSIRVSGEQGEQKTETRIELADELVPELQREQNTVDALLASFLEDPGERAVHYEGSFSRVKTNVINRRAEKQALVASLQYGLVETLGGYLKLPHWRIFVNRDKPDEEVRKTAWFEVPESRQQQIRTAALDEFESNPMRWPMMLYSSGVTILPDDTQFTAEEEGLIAEFLDQYPGESKEAIYAQLWDEVSIGKAAGLQGLYKKPIKKRVKKNIWQKMGDGLKQLTAEDKESQTLILFVFVMYVAMATAATVYTVPYYALGMEIAPSYKGRTRAVVARAFLAKIMNIVGAIFLPISFLPVFANAKEGNIFLATVMFFISIAATLIVVSFTRERTVIVRSKKRKPKFFRSIKEIGSSKEFWRICGLYLFLGITFSTFNVLKIYIVTYYVFEGDLLLGASYSGLLKMFGTAIAIGVLPIMLWMCNKFDKHNAFRIALGMMLVASALKLFCYTPDAPHLMFIVEIPWAFGISSVYMILGTMMADVTDLDELKHGERREAMFGSVMAIIMKSLGTIGAVTGGIVLAISGFVIEDAFYQDPGVFQRMVFLFSIPPAITGILGFLMLRNFKLTSSRMTEIKEELAVRRKERAEQNEDSAEAAPA